MNLSFEKMDDKERRTAQIRYGLRKNRQIGQVENERESEGRIMLCGIEREWES